MTPITDIKFSYGLGQPGHAVATFSFDGTESDFALTNVCNPLGDMMSAMATLISNPQHLWEKENKVAFVWYCEDESYNWTLILGRDERLRIRVTQSCEFFGDDEVEIIDGVCEFSSFVLSVISEMDKNLKRWGILNYQQLWQSNEFPITDFLFLKRYLIDNGKWVESPNPQDGILAHEINLLMM